MPREVHAETEEYRIEYDPEIDACIHTWKSFTSGADFREGANAFLEFFESRECDAYLVDTSGIQSHDAEDQQWLQEVWVPKMIDAGMEAAATVFPDSVIAAMDIEELEADLADLPYEAYFTDDMADARQWIVDQR